MEGSTGQPWKGKTHTSEVWKEVTETSLGNPVGKAARNRVTRMDEGGKGGWGKGSRMLGL